MACTGGNPSGGTQPIRDVPCSNPRLALSVSPTLSVFGSPQPFDPNGNRLTQTGPSGTITYGWDARNRLAGISGPTVAASFSYDAVGRRISKGINGVTTTYQYDGLDIVRESGGGGEASYLRTLAIDEALARTDASGTSAYLSDLLGNNVALVDSTGSPITTYTYAPFGETAASGAPASNPVQFTGRENDGTGLYYYRARYYDPVRGRFISEDPIGFAGGATNLFGYAVNNPMYWIDPLGLVLTDEQIANIIYNETRSLSGENIAQSRENIAQAIINGDEALGDKRPITAPTTANVPSNEQQTYQACRDAVESARRARSSGNDPTRGAMNFNFRNNDSTAPFYGLPVQTQVGPLNNSYTRGGLNATGVYGNTYGGRR